MFYIKEGVIYLRLQKYIAHSGIASRRKAEELIKLGRVRVNEKIIKDMGVIIDPNTDIVSVDNHIIKPEENKTYIILNKPEGYVTTLCDELNRRTVIDLVKEIPERIYPVGRLDYNTSGLLIMTNDGNLTFHLTHPKHQVPKTYIVKISGRPTRRNLNLLSTGIDIGGYITAPAEIQLLKANSKSCTIKITIFEGKNRQIRRMFEKIDHPVIHLKRIAIGTLTLNKLPKGKWRYLTNNEIHYLKSL